MANATTAASASDTLMVRAFQRSMRTSCYPHHTSTACVSGVSPTPIAAASLRRVRGVPVSARSAAPRRGCRTRNPFLLYSPEVTALYRKYRPQDFDEVVGQEAVVRTLRNAI